MTIGDPGSDDQVDIINLQIRDQLNQSIGYHIGAQEPLDYPPNNGQPVL